MRDFSFMVFEFFFPNWVLMFQDFSFILEKYVSSVTPRVTDGLIEWLQCLDTTLSLTPDFSWGSDTFFPLLLPRLLLTRSLKSRNTLICHCPVSLMVSLRSNCPQFNSSGRKTSKVSKSTPLLSMSWLLLLSSQVSNSYSSQSVCLSSDCLLLKIPVRVNFKEWIVTGKRDSIQDHDCLQSWN